MTARRRGMPRKVQYPGWIAMRMLYLASAGFRLTKLTRSGKFCCELFRRTSRVHARIASRRAPTCVLLLASRLRRQTRDGA